MDRVGVAILTYNPGVEILDTVRGVLDSKIPCRDVVVVDNASSAGALDEVRRAHPSLNIHVMDANVGYGAAMNRAATLLHADGAELYLFLTQETWLEPGALQRLVKHMNDQAEVGLVGPLLGRKSAPDEVWSAGGALGRLTGKPRHHAAREPVQQSRPPLVDVGWLDGACLLVRDPVFRAAGGFREDLFLYWEDVQLSLAVQGAGWRVCCATDAIALQEPSMTPPYLMARNQALVLGRRGVVGAATGIAGWLVRDVKHGRGLRRASLGVAGLRDALRGASINFDIALERP